MPEPASLSREQAPELAAEREAPAAWHVTAWPVECHICETMGARYDLVVHGASHFYVEACADDFARYHERATASGRPLPVLWAVPREVAR